MLKYTPDHFPEYQVILQCYVWGHRNKFPFRGKGTSSCLYQYESCHRPVSLHVALWSHDWQLHVADCGIMEWDHGIFGLLTPGTSKILQSNTGIFFPDMLPTLTNAISILFTSITVTTETKYHMDSSISFGVIREFLEWNYEHWLHGNLWCTFLNMESLISNISWWLGFLEKNWIIWNCPSATELYTNMSSTQD